MVGCGALGSFYGSKLCAAGADVHFLLRSDYDVVKRMGVQIHSVDGDFHVHPECARRPEEIGACDLVLIGLKTTANAEFGKLLPPLLGPGTAVVTLQNGLGNEETLAEVVGEGRVLGGLCFVCLNRTAPGVVQHTAHGNVILGEYRRPPQARTEAYAELFRRAGVRCQVTDNLARTRWEKLIWNIPFNGLGVAGVAGYDAVVSGRLTKGRELGPCLATDALLGDPRWAELVRELMQEVIEAAAGFGYKIPESVIGDLIEKTQRMGAYKASTLVDFERGQALELESMFVEPLRRAKAVGVVTPRLEALASILTQLAQASELPHRT